MKNLMSGVSTAEFLLFLKGKFPVIHNSNFFFRDLHYGVMSYLQARGRKAGHDESERCAREIADRFVAEGIFKKIDHQSWCVDYPPFALPRTEKPAIEKATPEKTATRNAPAATAAAAQ
ncbi:MAG TPA: hypothetical protein VI932_02130 [Bacteroidota bacterium]|nr:hypothetical protein [Bacteroidota bacterium]